MTKALMFRTALSRLNRIPAHRIAVALLLLIPACVVVRAQEKAPRVSYPPGAIAAFRGTLPLQSKALPALRVFVQGETNSSEVWEAEPLEIASAESSETNETDQGAGLMVGFAVPQLPAGSYAAWLEDYTGAGQRLKFSFIISPRLFGDYGYISESVGSEITVTIRIASPLVQRKGSKTLEAARVFATGDQTRDRNRRKDYTTPNMFAMSDRFEFFGRVFGPPLR